ncbi:MAG: hypothetical protein KAT65_25345 [Methanophagales archaeon]|nr:hypothetical protein [Methanophagales archaeon]
MLSSRKGKNPELLKDACVSRTKGDEFTKDSGLLFIFRSGNISTGTETISIREEVYERRPNNSKLKEKERQIGF